jgi:type IX secretion system substrate protein/Ig-like domain-containing protein
MIKNYTFPNLMQSFDLWLATKKKDCNQKENFSKQSFMSKPHVFLLFGLLMMFFSSQVAFSQVTTNSGSGLAPAYASLDAAITALNGATITSPVVITLTGNETAPAGGYAITAQGSLANTILIQGSASTITASAALTAGNLNDGIFKLIGADYVTIQSFTMVENAANTTTAAASNNMTEWGVALLYASATNGCQNISLLSNIIDLNRTYQNTFGIYSNSTHSATTVITSATATGSTGGNHGLKINDNTINDVNMGIVVIGPTAAADNNDGLEIGLTMANRITDFGTTGTFSAYANVSTSVNGILVRNTKNFTITGNIITSSNGGVSAGTLRGIYIPAFSNAPTGTIVNSINSNVLSVRSGNAAGTILGIHNEATTVSATTTLNINNNDFTAFGHTVAGTVANTLIQNAAATLNTNINGNTFTNLSVNTTGSFTFISNSVTHPAGGITNVNNNSVVTGFSKTGAGGTVYFYDSFGSTTSGMETNTGNNFSNITLTGATTLNGFRTADGGGTYPSKLITNNTFNNITNGAGTIVILNVGFSFAGTNNDVTGNTISNISGGGAVTGITSSAGSQNFFGNTIYGLVTTGGSAVSGISITGGVTQNIYKNKIYNLEANNATGTVNGILVTGGTTANIYNNITGDLRTPIANAANPLNGINITGGTTSNVYYNTVMLNASSAGALFGSSAISVATGPAVTLRNNIFVNNSAVMGAGLATVYRRSSTTLTSYGSASNNNLFYGSTIYTDGTNTDATLAAYKARVTPRDGASVSENPTFTSLVGGNSQFLHINTGVPTLIEAGAAPIASYTDDFEGDVRNGSTPDIGADEFAGTPISVVVINSISPNPIVNQCVAASRTISANVTAGGNDITSVMLNYSFNGVVQTPIAMTGGTLTAGTTSTFTAAIPAATPANANVTWSVTATDPLVTKNTIGTAYQDEPLFGLTATASATVNTFCYSGTSSLSAVIVNNGPKTVGSGALATTVSGTSGTNYVSPFTHYYGGYKAQYLIRASELTAAGFYVGSNLTSLAFDVSAAGTTYNGFTVSMGATAVNALTTTFETSSLTQVYNGNLNVAATGLLTLPFGTGGGSSAAFVWDGTSNILINLCWSNANTGGTAAEVRYDATSFAAMSYYRVDSASQATVCAAATATATQSNRPKMVFGGTFGPTVTAISWSDGSTTVGSGNNLSVSPTTTTTYTATLTALGCTISTNPVTITVNTTAAPTGTINQTFCNSATVADLTATGTAIQWYAGPSGGSALLSTDALVNGTHYYASQTISGCESATRLDVTATINVTAQPSAAPQAFCNSATVADLVATGTAIQWYAGPVGGSALLSTDALSTGTYYVTQTISGCESPRLSVSVTVNVVGAPTGSSAQVISVPIPTDATIEDIVVVGSNIIWYPSSADALAGTNALAAGTILVSGLTYYATQTVGGCTSATSLAVTVTVTLGVDNFTMSNLKVYPNPTFDVLNIENAHAIVGIEIYTITGQKVAVKTINEVTASIDMSGLAGGTYLVKVISDTAVKTVKVLKK